MSWDFPYVLVMMGLIFGVKWITTWRREGGRDPFEPVVLEAPLQYEAAPEAPERVAAPPPEAEWGSVRTGFQRKQRVTDHDGQVLVDGRIRRDPLEARRAGPAPARPRT